MTLKQARQLAGFTQGEAANALKITASAISAWEAGTAEPRARTFMAACRLYGVKPEDIFLDTESKKDKQWVQK